MTSPPGNWPLDRLLDLADSGIVVLGPTAAVERWNAWMAQRSGIKEEEAFGRTLPQLFGPDLGSRLSSAVKDCLAHAHAHILSPSLNHRPLPLSVAGSTPEDRIPIETAVTVKPLQGQDGLRHCLIQVVDVSLAARRERFLRGQANQLSQLVEALREAKDAATRANVAKSGFLTDMSHELRSPLNAIIGFSQLLELKQSGPLSAEQHEFVTYIRKAGEHLLKMVTDILDLSKIEAQRLTIEPKDIEVDRFVLDRIKGMKSLAHGRHIDVHYAPFEGGSLHLRADPRRLTQIMINLLSNAIKYNRTGGGVTVSAAIPEAGRVRLSVSDTGPGIPATRQPELFQSFNRLGAEFGEIEGAGIGLALSRKLAELMGGAMGFESRAGVGSSFWVDMPMSGPCRAARALVDECSGSAHEAAALPPFTLLYIDDNPVDLRLVSALFRSQAGTRLITARTGEDGLELARTQRPDVILLDIVLPGLNGFEVQARLRSDDATRTIPALAISASALPADMARGEAAGFRRWLTKPLDIAEFLSVLADLLSGRDADTSQPPS